MKRFVRQLMGRPDPEPEHNVPLPAAGERVYCIGDIHGRLDLLQELHRMILRDAGQGEETFRVVYLGDYIDRGMHSRGVIDELLASPLDGFETVYLAGNHERTLLDFLEHPQAAAGWLAWGGRETLASYGVPLYSNTPPDPEETRDLLLERLPGEHLQFYRDMQLMHVSGNYLFVHAGIRPGRPLQEQSSDDLLWIRDDFTRSRQQHEYVVVHGHTISEEVEFHSNRIGIDTGAYYSGVLTCLVLQGDEQRLLQTGQAA